MWINQPNYGQIQWEQDRAHDAEVEKADRINKYNKWLQDTIGYYGPEKAKQYASSIGLNPADDRIGTILQQIVGDIGGAAPRDMESGNPEALFGPDAFQQRFNDYESRQRRANTSQVRNAFAPGFENNLMPDTDIDSIVNQILGEQKGLANTKLGYQQKRGLLSPQGTEQANKSLASQEAAGRSTLSGLARGALDKDRAALLDLVSKAGSAASTWTLGADPFKVDPYRQQVQSRAATERAGFGGDVRAALGNTQLFDIPTIIAQAGTAQGSDNLNFGSIPGGSRKKGNTDRGLGSVGGF